MTKKSAIDSGLRTGILDIFGSGDRSCFLVGWAVCFTLGFLHSDWSGFCVEADYFKPECLHSDWLLVGGLIALPLGLPFSLAR